MKSFALVVLLFLPIFSFAATIEYIPTSPTNITYIQLNTRNIGFTTSFSTDIDLSSVAFQLVSQVNGASQTSFLEVYAANTYNVTRGNLIATSQTVSNSTLHTDVGSVGEYANGANAATFTFTTPITLQKNVPYYFVIKTNNSNTQIRWVGTPQNSPSGTGLKLFYYPNYTETAYTYIEPSGAYGTAAWTYAKFTYSSTTVSSGSSVSIDMASTTNAIIDFKNSFTFAFGLILFSFGVMTLYYLTKRV